MPPKRPALYKPLRVAPGLTPYDVAHRRRMNAVLPGQFSLPGSAIRRTPDLPHLTAGQLGATVAPASRLSVRRLPIGDVVGMRAGAQMGRVAAGWVVAAVAHDVAGLERAVVQDVAHAVRRLRRALVVEAAVAVPAVGAASVGPACSCVYSYYGYSSHDARRIICRLHRPRSLGV